MVEMIIRLDSTCKIKFIITITGTSKSIGPISNVVTLLGQKVTGLGHISPGWSSLTTLPISVSDMFKISISTKKPLIFVLFGTTMIGLH
ncbi:233_t:CDS:2 [Ambispora leptoticha]|uniref:233_t:CDS:1 n=1 Tax=Ambispora leptoticha TaxID=144679 RepID=A0A9N9F2R2_9GLOM|nr:233_t:CDS:2 [Ambispora leptoticha]